MAEQIYVHSDEWFEKLILLRITNDFTQIEYRDMMIHLLGCPVCQHAIAENAIVEQMLDALPDPHFPFGMSPRIEAMWQEEDRLNESTNADSLISNTNF
jgi:hypothetical protein